MNTLIEALIVDDEQDGRIGLENLLLKYCPSVKIIGMAEGVHDAYKKIKLLKPQLVFLDIKMDDGTAFDLLKKISHFDFRIIFVTAYDEYAIEAIRFGAFDYLLKPVIPALLIESVEKLKKTIRIDVLEEQVKLLLQDKGKREKIALPASNGLLFVRIPDIVRCESDSSYTTFVLASGKKILVTRTMKEYESLLPPDVFFRAHKSHIINLNYVRQYVNRDGTYIILDNNDSIPLARNRKDEFLEKIKQ